MVKSNVQNVAFDAGNHNITSSRFLMMSVGIALTSVGFELT
jgi:hypothetical protein